MRLLTLLGGSVLLSTGGLLLLRRGLDVEIPR